jgi:hypothetical protein
VPGAHQHQGLHQQAASRPRLTQGPPSPASLPQGLPVRGQRTKTNARTRKGKTKTVAGKKKLTR